jgi:oligopeptide/dipeptide ABC transporter ATP-binding protein
MFLACSALLRSFERGADEGWYNPPVIAALANSAPALLEARRLRVRFPLGRGEHLTAVDGVDLSVVRGEVLGIAGESGCGKSVLAHSLLRLLDDQARTEGDLLWQGQGYRDWTERELRAIRGRGIAMVFQNPQASLNPARTIGAQLRSVLKLAGADPSVGAQEALLAQVRIPDPSRVLASYPSELSGGMCQRISLAMALACRPSLLIADEPTTSLDVTVQAQILALLQDIQKQTGLAVVLISHDLGLLAQMCDRIAVMYLGRIVELAPAVDIFKSPRHPYTKALLASVLVPDPSKRERLPVLAGEPPSARRIPKGSCRFMDRCEVRMDACQNEDPALIELNKGRAVACLRHVPTGHRELV